MPLKKKTQKKLLFTPLEPPKHFFTLKDPRAGVIFSPKFRGKSPKLATLKMGSRALSHVHIVHLATFSPAPNTGIYMYQRKGL